MSSRGEPALATRQQHGERMPKIRQRYAISAHTGTTFAANYTLDTLVVDRIGLQAKNGQSARKCMRCASNRFGARSRLASKPIDLCRCDITERRAGREWHVWSAMRNIARQVHEISGELALGLSRKRRSDGIRVAPAFDALCVAMLNTFFDLRLDSPPASDRRERERRGSTGQRWWRRRCTGKRKWRCLRVPRRSETN